MHEAVKTHFEHKSYAIYTEKAVVLAVSVNQTRQVKSAITSS